MLLAGDSLVISEFMAINDDTLADGNGEFKDWIEIFNPTADPVDLTGWYLTDDSTELDKWPFPARTINSGEYLVVFASGQDVDDYVDPGGYLHTNFKLDGDGEDLALVAPDGQTVVHAYWDYPSQVEDISYGVTYDVFHPVSSGIDARFWVPDSSDAALEWTAGDPGWTAPEYDDAAWPDTPSQGGQGATGIGYSSQPKVFDVTTYGSKVPLLDLVQAEVVLADVSLQNGSVSGTAEVINYLNTGSFGRYASDNPFPGIPIGTSYSNFLIEATASLLIPSAGEWTFGVNSNDGFSLALTDGTESFSMEFPGQRSAGDTLSTFTFANAGTYDLRLVMFQYVGGAEVELFAAQGSHDVFDPAAFALVGDVASGGLPLSPMQTDVEDILRGESTSLWTRIPFEVDDPTLFDSMVLGMQYNDGFVAYLNGQEIARRNAPDPIQYNSAATAAAPVDDPFVYETFDVTAALDVIEEGTNTLAIHGLNHAIADPEFLITPTLTATSNLRTPQYMLTPTPGLDNVGGALGYVGDTRFSVDRGFYDTPQTIEISTDTPGATIYYTLDGTPPTEADGIEYTGPLTIDHTTTLRAAAFKPGYEPSNVDTQTYLFLDDVIQQDYQATLAAGFPTSWGGTSPDYGMDPDVIGPGDLYGGVYAATIRDDLQALPTLSIVMDVDDLFASDGIYTNSTQHGEEWERPASVELIYPDLTEGFQIDAGIRIQGGAFRNHSLTKKHSLRLLFKEEYGPTKLRYPLFGDEAVDEFDTITLRAGANDGYSWSAAQYTEQYIRDEFGRDLQRAAGHVASEGTFVHLYINGIYWGLYNPVERPDNAFSASYFGGDKDEWDSIHDDVATDGTLTAWNQMRAQAQAAATSLAAYQQLQGNNPDGTPNPAYPDLLDVDNYVDYMIINIWGGNWDWPNKNYWAGRDQTADSTGFKSYMWDFENTMGNNRSRSPLNMVSPRSTVADRGIGVPHQDLIQNPEYRLLFADRIHEFFFNSGILTPESLVPRYSDLAAEVERAIVAESARWGDQHYSTPLTLDDWYNERQWILGTYLPQRSDIVLQQFVAAGLYPGVTAPSFNVDGTYQHGGVVAEGADMTMSGPMGADYEIWYTVDGTDPRLFGGALNTASAGLYDGTPLTLAETSIVKARAVFHRGQADESWSALNSAKFYVHPAAAGNLAITEINYHPHVPTGDELAIDPEWLADDFEYIELLNTGDDWIDLADVRLDGGVEFEFSLADSTRLDPGQYALVVRDLAAFEARYGAGLNVAGTFTGALNNAGDDIELVDPFDIPILEFRYDDDGGWPGRADGTGASLEVLDTAGDYNDQANWRSSAEYGGTPGHAGSGLTGDVLVNEVLTHTDLPDVDTIELVNPSPTDPVDLSGWYLSDSNNDLTKYRIPDGTVLGPGAYIVFDEHDFGSQFALKSYDAEDVWLMAADGNGNLLRFVDHVEFGAAAVGESFGRWPDAQGDLYPMVTPTLVPVGGPNSGPRVGPVVIRELFYAPAAGGYEFVELYNADTGTVTLYDPARPTNTWQFGAGIEFVFPEGVELAPGEVVLVVPTDEATFRAAYPGVPAEVRIFGPYSGVLDNAGERVRLERPDEPPAANPALIPFVLVDEVEYEPLAPWPVVDGQSLNRRTADAWGHAADSWLAELPTPGEVVFSPAAPYVAGRYVFYNDSVFDDGPAANASDDQAIAVDKQALLPGEKATFANYTSYDRGINGIMIDVAGLADPGALDADDFEFRVGNDDDPANWPAAPAPISGGSTVRQQAGANGSDRVTIRWADHAIEKRWLQVTVKATAHTGLAQPDVFYFGNAVGESGNSLTDARVTSVDEIAARHNPQVFTLAAVTNPYDYNRDGKVTSIDQILARQNVSIVDALELITVPDAVPAPAAAPVPAMHDAAISTGDWGFLLDFDLPSSNDSDSDDDAAAAVDRLLSTLE